MKQKLSPNFKRLLFKNIVDHNHRNMALKAQGFQSASHKKQNLKNLFKICSKKKIEKFQFDKSLQEKLKEIGNYNYFTKQNNILKNKNKKTQVQRLLSDKKSYKKYICNKQQLSILNRFLNTSKSCKKYENNFNFQNCQTQHRISYQSSKPKNILENMRCQSNDIKTYNRNQCDFYKYKQKKLKLVKLNELNVSDIATLKLQQNFNKFKQFFKFSGIISSENIPIKQEKKKLLLKRVKSKLKKQKLLKKIQLQKSIQQNISYESKENILSKKKQRKTKRKKTEILQINFQQRSKFMQRIEDLLQIEKLDCNINTLYYNLVKLNLPNYKLFGNHLQQMMHKVRQDLKRNQLKIDSYQIN